ncbi:MarR family winged helix-turn-helix transcriptional regulator [Shewanella sp. AS16]|uniref:MarR family winged helix-turn-helix transcriptional regulator n=1 Tax=Shewanella sp. AS16 TaxID=2907625 RepID=UPI001F2B7094|nr:MarR family winged helix-turn-helix transcriptional regulator [Shewanella sp. AS16]MCE9685717.1 MarR family winged helix-turn-helix transcriptional regulator [Shewanella sp. AS16]
MKNNDDICDLLERLSTLFRNEVRQAGLVHGLHPVHLEVLFYLNKCNKFSDTPAAVKDFLGATKGTTSKSISLLETKGYVVKKQDTKDKRVYHLSLTEAGRQIAADNMPPMSLRAALTRCSGNETSLKQQLESLLVDIQTATSNLSFGLCKTCRFHLAKNNTAFFCELTGEDLPSQYGELICREHTLRSLCE